VAILVNEQLPEEKSVLIIEFTEVGSVMFKPTFMNVTPMQLLAIASYLELKAKNEIIKLENEQAMREAQASIARPQSGIILPK